MKRAELQNIHKKFDDNAALSGVTLSFFPGELHTILGENGAGKSTLVHILSGLHQPTSGRIQIGGQEISFSSPSQALSAGVAMVHQRPLLCDELSVLENIILGSPGWKLSINKRRKEVSKLAAQWQIPLDLDSPSRTLSAADRLFTALLGALYRSPDFLILDEPSGVFSPEERTGFFESLTRARDRGLGIILITHRIEEALKWSDRISVLREGLLVFSALLKCPPKNIPITIENLTPFLNPDQRESSHRAEIKNDIEIQTEEIVFETRDISFQRTNRPGVRNISFTVQKSEIIGIFGLPGSGLSSLEDILCGMLKPDTGSITILGSQLQPYQITPSLLRKLGVGFVPQDRCFRASHPALSIKDILIPYQQNSFIRNTNKETLFVHHILQQENISGPENRRCSTLSGGQLQRLILARELYSEKKILILSEPDWGLDIQSTEKLKIKLIEATKRGMAIVILTDNPDSLKSNGFFTKTWTLSEGTLK